MSRASQTSEREFVGEAIRAVRGGDREAFRNVVETYRRRIFGLLLMMTRDRAGAEDVTQEAFVRAYMHLDRFDPSREFYPWLATISVRLAKSWLKRRAAIEAHEGAEVPEGMHGGDSPDLLAGLLEDERARRLWRRVAALPQGERMAVFLHYREDLSVAETAQALGVAGGTVKTMLFRARKKLERDLDEPADADVDQPEERR